MQRNAKSLILLALRLIGVQDPDQRSNLVSQGMEVLNLIIDSFSTSGFLIPTMSVYEFAAVGGQQEYVFSDIIIPADFATPLISSIDFITVNIAGLSTPLDQWEPTSLYTNTLVLNNVGPPSIYNLEKYPDSSVLKIFPIPDAKYYMTMRCRFNVGNLTENAIIKNLPVSYHQFLTYAVAREMVAYFPSYNWSETMEEKYQSLRSDIAASNSVDLSIQTPRLLERYYYMPGYNLRGVT